MINEEVFSLVMLKQIQLENWKSFRHSTLYLDPLTILMGTNASGKSNVVDAIDFLNRLATIDGVEVAIKGDKLDSGLRGGVEWIARKPESHFTLEVVFSANESDDYLYRVQVETEPELQISLEFLRQLNEAGQNGEINHHNFEILSYRFGKAVELILERKELNSSDLETLFPAVNTKLDTRVSLSGKKDFALPFQGFKTAKGMYDCQVTLLRLLSNIFVFNPIPSLMRDYTPLSKKLEQDGSNLAGVLAALPESEKVQLEEKLRHYLSQLPEGDMRKVWAEPVGRLKSDAMLYCEEMWNPHDPPITIDARGMSDGTLRFLAIMTAMLTRPQGSLIVIEEVDNGLHPSRAGLLLQMLREIGQQRQIDVLVTTHNPALLDELAPDLIPCVMVTYRDLETGDSELIPLEDIEDLPKLMASGTLGTVATKGWLEKSLH